MNKKALITFAILIFSFCGAIPAKADLRVEDFYPELRNIQLTAASAIVWDESSGQVLFSKNAVDIRVPASLTKLLSAMVILDSKVSLKKKCRLTVDDEVGGARLSAKAGAQYTLNDALTASLVGSLNNTTRMVSSCVGLSREQFVEKMNAKARSLGAVHSVFYEPAGMDPKNSVTADDISKIARASFSYPAIQKILQKPSFTICSLNAKKSCQKIKNTNALLSDKDVKILGGKTGYLDEAMFNFAAIVKNETGRKIGVVVLGSSSKANSFAEAKLLAQYQYLPNFSSNTSVGGLAINN